MSARSGARRRARRRRTLRRLTLLLLALLVTGVAVYVGLRPADPEPTPASRPSPTPSSSPTPTDLAGLDLSGLPIERTAFCDVLDEGDVETALGAPPTGTAHYDSGDRAQLTTGVTDVAHEYNCTFDSATTGAQARVWVFAEPVTAEVGRSLAREARRQAGCTVVEDAPRYGRPSAATSCQTTSPAGQEVTLRGLFGDAWLSCRLSTSGGDGAQQPQEIVQRAEQWCVRVATTLGARP